MQASGQASIGLAVGHARSGITDSFVANRNAWTAQPQQPVAVEEDSMPENKDILSRIGDHTTPGNAIMPFLFHGSGEPLEGPMRPGGYDGVFWTADTPAVAQCYIPRSSGRVMVDFPAYQLDQRVRPAMNDSVYQAAIQMSGVRPEVEWDAYGASKSWTIPKGWPTNRELLSWFQDNLGYADAIPDKAFWAASQFNQGQDTLLHRDFRLQGSLLTVDGRHLNFFDHAQGREGDLQDPDHNKLDLFRRVEAAGYDGIIIPDFCQSPAWGNVGHLSWGIFPSAMADLEWVSVPAVAFDWPEDQGGLSQTVTPEFEIAWQCARDAAETPRIR